MSPSHESKPLSFEKVLAEEIEDIDRQPLASAIGKDLEETYSNIHKLDLEEAPTALCLSGGGIRSATFALGVLQGLARKGLLTEFDYLSTVSGGGYIGGWLSAWIRHHAQGTEGVAQELEQGSGESLAPEPKPVRWLRAYSNYLSPKLGFFSADTWTLVATFARNLILNWLILLPMLTAVLLLPRISVAMLSGGAPSGAGDWWFVLLSLAAGAIFAVAAISQLPSYLPSCQVQGARSPCSSEARFVASHVVPLVVSAVLLTTSWFSLGQVVQRPGFPYSQHYWSIWDLGNKDGLVVFVILGVLLNALGWGIGLARNRRVHWGLRFMSLTIVAVGAVEGFIAWWAATDLLSPSATGPVSYVTAAAPLLLSLYLVASFLLAGIASYKERRIQDPDREWLVRSGGWLLIMAAAWLILSATALWGPWAILEIESAIARWFVAVGGTASGVISAIIGWTSKTSLSSEKGGGKLVTIATRVAEAILAPVFVVTLLAFISLVVTQVSLRGFPAGSARHFFALEHTLWWSLALAAILLLAAGYIIGRVLSVNRFSFHAMYRNRLIRAYLGASREGRRTPDVVTGFDVDDNLLMDDLKYNGRPFHLVNIALNLTAGEDLAWQQRQAMSFTVSHKHSGNWLLGYQPSKRYTDAGGISLGTAMTVSGAAASPNMGYHSSKALAFLMALFNVRLGAWLPNPKCSDEELLGSSTPNSPLVLLREALGMADKEHRWVYLSDGGHFENLGLYEMVRRRSKLIVLSDAGADPGYDLGDLANAVHKIRVDMGIPIEQAKPPEFQPKERGFSKHAALLRVRYSAIDGNPEESDGWILHIKPAVSGDEQRDVKQYSDAHATFPQQTTVDQFFDESQFESYRRLGEHSIEQISGATASFASLKDFFKAAARYA